MLITDPWFYITAVPAVLIYGIGKGGFGGAMGVIAVPLMALAVSPMQAAAVLLPILCVMDIFAIRVHYRYADYTLLKRMLPAAFIGVFLASILMGFIEPVGLNIVVGLLSLLFFLQYLFKKHSSSQQGNVWLWCILGGFSSTTIHAGGGPVSIYLLPQKLEKVTLIATMALFFGIVNLCKLIPYTLLGNFDTTNLFTAALLMPLAPVGVKVGVILLHRSSEQLIYRVSYLFLFLSGAKLLGDGLQIW